MVIGRVVCKGLVFPPLSGLALSPPAPIPWSKIETEVAVFADATLLMWAFLGSKEKKVMFLRFKLADNDPEKFRIIETLELHSKVLRCKQAEGYTIYYTNYSPHGVEVLFRGVPSNCWTTINICNLQIN